MFYSMRCAKIEDSPSISWMSIELLIVDDLDPFQFSSKRILKQRSSSVAGDQEWKYYFRLKHLGFNLCKWARSKSGYSNFLSKQTNLHSADS